MGQLISAVSQLRHRLRFGQDPFVWVFAVGLGQCPHCEFEFVDRCDLVAREISAGTRVVHATPAVAVLAAYAARTPFELWVVPVAHQARFEEAPLTTLEPLAAVLHTVLARIDVALERPAYNVVLHSAPFHDPVDAAYHWHLEITPRVLRPTGFEAGSGTAINPVAPEEAAKVLRTGIS